MLAAQSNCLRSDYYSNRLPRDKKTIEFETQPPLEKVKMYKSIEIYIIKCWGVLLGFAPISLS